MTYIDSSPVPSTVAAAPRLPALDALRAIGATAVVGTHVGFATGASGDPRWGGLLARLDVGVALFFVLSGFLLFRPYAYAAAHCGTRPHPRRYLWRRALRIVPAYWVSVFACLTLLPGNADTPPGDWFRFATFTQIYTPGHLHDALGHTWSLATEVAFYLVLPLVVGPVLGTAWRPGRTVLALLGSGALITGGWLVAMAAGQLDMGLHTMWLPAFAVWFAAGMALATVHVALESGTGPACWRTVADCARAPLACGSLALGLFVIASTPVTGPRDLTEPTAGQFAARTALFLCVAVAVLVPAAFADDGPVPTALSTPLARWLGTVSYGLFLWHPFVLAVLYLALGRPAFSGGLLSTYLLTMAGGLVLASVSWYALERPLQRWDRLRVGRRHLTTVDPVPVAGAATAPSQRTANADSAAS